MSAPAAPDMSEDSLFSSSFKLSDAVLHISPSTSASLYRVTSTTPLLFLKLKFSPYPRSGSYNVLGSILYVHLGVFCNSYPYLFFNGHQAAGGLYYELAIGWRGGWDVVLVAVEEQVWVRIAKDTHMDV